MKDRAPDESERVMASDDDFSIQAKVHEIGRDYSSSH